MEEEWIVDRSKLREVWFEHPNWSRKKMAKEVGRSEAWARKWLKRIRQAPLEDREVLNGRSRAPVLATWLIRPELSGKRGLSCYFLT
jgi:transposase